MPKNALIRSYWFSSCYLRSTKKAQGSHLGLFIYCIASELTRIGSYQQLLQGDEAEQQSTDYYLRPPAAQSAVEGDVGLHYAHNQYADQGAEHIAVAAG